MQKCWYWSELVGMWEWEDSWLNLPLSPPPHSASGASVVAIDNKIEQAMVSVTIKSRNDYSGDTFTVTSGIHSFSFQRDEISQIL